MRLPLPGPSELLAAATSLREGVQTALELVPRIATVVEQIEVLVARVERAVTSIEATSTAVNEVVDRVQSTQRRADDAVASAQGIVNRVDPLLDSYEEPLRALSPVLRRLADTTSEADATAVIGLLDRLPRLVEHVDDDLLPLLATLDRVGPDLHDLLDVTQDLRQVITGLPGVGFLRRRGEEEPPSGQDSG
jgi:ABC-type transporter Mla subunit MlaD